MYGDFGIMDFEINTESKFTLFIYQYLCLLMFVIPVSLFKKTFFMKDYNNNYNKKTYGFIYLNY